MAADPTSRPSAPELEALRGILATTPAAVYLPATCRVYRCPNILHPGATCERAATFTIPEAQLLAARLRAGELGPIPPGLGPIVLAYGIPWTAT